jgi:hypothetical protein
MTCPSQGMSHVVSHADNHCEHDPRPDSNLIIVTLRRLTILIIAILHLVMFEYPSWLTIHLLGRVP